MRSIIFQSVNYSVETRWGSSTVEEVEVVEVAQEEEVAEAIEEVIEVEAV